MCHMLDNSRDNPLTPVEIKYPEEWSKVVNVHGNFIVFLDDFIGSFNLDTDAMEKWKNHVNFIFPSIKGQNIYLMFGIRKNVMEAAKNFYQYYEFFSERYIIDFSKEFALSEKEKLTMLEAYEKKYINKNASLQGKEMNGHLKENATEKICQLSDLDKTKIVQSNPFYGFPLTCFQFFTIRECYELGPAFFLRPNRELFTRIENMRTSNNTYEKIRYTVLSYIFVHGSICIVDFDVALYETVCSKVRLEGITKIEIQDAIHSMDGSFLSKSSKGKYVFSHDTIFETVLVSFGQLAPDVVIKMCSRQKLQELIRTENCEMKQHEVVLKITKENFSDLCQRMLHGDDGDDITSKPLLAARDIAWHPASTDPNFVSHLLHLDASERLIDVLSELLKVLPFCPQKEPTLLFMLLEDFGPHITNLEESRKPTITDAAIFKLVSEIVQFTCDKEKYILCILRYVQKYRNVENLVDAKIGGQSFHSLSLIHYCVLHGWSNAVNFILQYRDPIKTGENWTCAHIAAYAGRFELLSKFEARNQDVERLERTNEGYSVLQTAMLGLRYGLGEVYKPSYSMKTGMFYSFHFSIVFPGEESFRNVLNFLLQVGNTKTTPNDIEMRVDDIHNDNAVIHALVNHSQYDTNRRYCDPTQKYGNNIVFYLTIHNYADILVLLLKENRGIALYRNENELPTPLHLAAYLGRYKIVKILLECGVFVQTPALELSLLEAVKSGEKLCGRTLRYDLIKHEKNDWISCWNDGENEILDFKLKSVMFVKVRFGNASDFRDTSEYIQGNRELALH
ncbi:uncharacterized protein LOC133198742 [Saccostrea echinata]|uniref:uncharacterized protein LOC133198742 n=1 Tax=Saccostrea echinata TaxID=191078 RepID=UPI002A80A224|nr:uncharacterized protein LOC133198742 [Saccostrea echinata]